MTFRHEITFAPAVLHRLDKLIGLLGGMTKAEVATLTARLHGVAFRLEDITNHPNPRSRSMAVPQQLLDVLQKVDDDTTAVAATVKSLRDQISTGMTQADVDAVKGKLSDVATRLEATASNPDQPVPNGPPPSP